MISHDKIAAILKTHGVVLGYLFGSYARGSASPVSDLDLAVLFPNNIDPSEQEAKEEAICSMLEQACDVPQVDILNLSRVDNIVLKAEIVFEGKPVLVRDNSLKSALERRVLHEYEDTRYLLEISYHAMKDHLRNGSFGKIEGIK